MRTDKRIAIGVVVLLCLLSASSAAAFEGWTSGNAGVEGESVAIQTFVHSEYANGLVRLEFDWRDNTGDVLRFRCINDSDYGIRGWVVEVDPNTGAETELWTGYCQPHTTVTLPVNRFNLRWDTVDGGLMMGNYQIRTRWPAAG